MVGNSSSGIREGAFIGTPVVNIGSRQDSRERGSNVINASHDSDDILTAIKSQILKGRYPHESIYGDGTAGSQIAEILSTTNPPVQKRIAY